MKKVLLAALASGIVLGCYSTLESFNKRVAKLSCVNAKECQTAAYEEAYGSLSECRDDVKEGLDELFAGCSYDASKGRKCIHELYKRRKDCGDYDMSGVSECEGVLTCSELPLDATLRGQLLQRFVVKGEVAAEDVGQGEDIETELDAAIDALE
mgnify:CR=1 FL=1